MAPGEDNNVDTTTKCHSHRHTKNNMGVLLILASLVLQFPFEKWVLYTFCQFKLTTSNILKKKKYNDTDSPRSRHKDKESQAYVSQAYVSQQLIYVSQQLICLMKKSSRPLTQ